MKVVINLSEDECNFIKQKELPSISDTLIRTGVPIAADATNRDVLNAIFPDFFDFDAAERWSGGEIVITSEWWNAPYQKGGEV